MNRIKAWLRLMRLGNAPTVLSALTGAWALYGGEPFQVAGVGVAIVAAYIGGMLLNDVFDLPFDQLHHPDRPLPQGSISRSHGIAAAILCGILTLALAGSQAQTEAVILLAAIVLYSWCHKSSVWRAALLLGICRGMAVLLAAATLGDGASGISTPIVLTLTIAHGAGGAAITVAASQEHQQRPGPGGVVPLTRLLPLGVFVLLDPPGSTFTDWATDPGMLAMLGWLVWEVACERKRRSDEPGQAVGAWIAGFSAVDLVVASWVLHVPSMALATICFVLSRVLQRFLPAT
ncbi:MAG: UbiA family prenyltransferase [Planctomycetota bacterium]|nr:UbiA family prenyltransferase [Planctomycetota bacterium]